MWSIYEHPKNQIELNKTCIVPTFTHQENKPEKASENNPLREKNEQRKKAPQKITSVGKKPTKKKAC